MRNIKRRSEKEQRAHARLRFMALYDTSSTAWVGSSEIERASTNLNRELMRYDAAFHPFPEAFQQWAHGGMCPYSDAFMRFGKKAVRAINGFYPSRRVYSSGPALKATELLKLVNKVRRMRRNAGLPQ